jgi:hypothetical protein
MSIEPIEKNITLLYILKMLFSEYPGAIDEYVFNLLCVAGNIQPPELTNAMLYLERREMVSYAHKIGDGFNLRFYFLTGKGYNFCRKKYA